MDLFSYISVRHWRVYTEGLKPVQGAYPRPGEPKKLINKVVWLNVGQGRELTLKPDSNLQATGYQPGTTLSGPV